MNNVRMISLGDVIELKYGKPILPGDRDPNGENCIYGANGILGRTNKYLIDNEALIVGRKGSAGQVNRVSGKFWPSDVTYYVLGSDEVNIDYLYFLLSFLKLTKLSKGVKPGLNRNDVYAIKVPLPQVEDQIRVSKVLQKADSLRKKRKQTVELLDEYVKSVFLDMFGDPITNSKKWDITPLGGLLASMTSGSRGWAKYFTDSGSLFITIKNVGRDTKLHLKDVTYIDPPDNAEAKRTKVKEGDVLMSITADLGRTAVVPKLEKDAYINQHLVILRLKSDINPIYLSHFLGSSGGQEQIQKLNKGAAKAGLNFNDIRSLKIPIPPMELQKMFESVLRRTEEIRAKMINQGDEMENQYQALMQKAFN